MPTDLDLPRARPTATFGGPSADPDHALPRRAGLPERALTAWLAVSGAGAFGGTSPARAVIREPQAWAADAAALLHAEAVQ